MLYCTHQQYFTALRSLHIMACQAVCSVLRTPIASIDHLKVQLPDPDALKVRWSLECFNGQFCFYEYKHICVKPCSNDLRSLINADADYLKMSPMMSNLRWSNVLTFIDYKSSDN